MACRLYREVRGDEGAILRSQHGWQWLGYGLFSASALLAVLVLLAVGGVYKAGRNEGLLASSSYDCPAWFVEIEGPRLLAVSLTISGLHHRPGDEREMTALDLGALSASRLIYGHVALV